MKSFRGSLRKVRDTYSDFIRWHKPWRGNYYFFRSFWLKLLGLLFRFDVLYLFRKDVVRQEEPCHDIKEITFEAATRNDYDAIRRLHPTRPPNYIEERLGRNELCYVARSRHQALCAYFWVAPGYRVFEYRSKTIHIDDCDVYLRDIETLPEYRGRGITPSFLEWIDSEMLMRGKRVMWAAVRGFNHSSQRSVKKAGFRIDERIYFASVPFSKKSIMFSKKRRESTPVVTD